MEKKEFLHAPNEQVTAKSAEAPEQNLYKTWVPPGHYCSPIPSTKEVLQRAHRIYNDKPMPGIHVNSKEQLKLLKKLTNSFKEQSFPKTRLDNKRYYFENEWFGLLDASVLGALVRFLAPKKIIEVGSGFSSAVMLDTQESMSTTKIDFTFIEPDPGRLRSLLKEEEGHFVTIKQTVFRMWMLIFLRRSMRVTSYL